MRILGLDRRKVGAALVAACCLTIPYFQRAPRRLPIPSLPVFFPPHALPSTQARSDAVAPVAPAAPAHDLSGVADALRYYGEGEILSGDAALTTKDPLVRDAVEWTVVRLHPGEAGLQRIAAFLRAHPDWPAAQLRKRGEELAASESCKPERAAAYFAEFPPTTPAGRLAAAELMRGDPARADEAARIARDLWRNAELGAALEKRLLKNFSGALSAADRIYRIDRLVLREQFTEGARAAQAAGKDGQKLFRAESDLAHGAPWAKVFPRAPATLRNDVGLLYMRIHAARHADHIDEAATLVMSAPRDPVALASPDDWWVERRLIARKLLDAGDARRAYRICADYAPGSNATNVEAEFTAGWIALRYLHDPKTAAAHFALIPENTTNPQALGRRGYWLGRAAEAMGHMAEAKAYYEQGARNSATYYGQLARARLGLADLGLRGPPHLTPEQRARLSKAEVVRAVELLYALDERDMLASIYAELGESATDVAGMTMLAEIAARHHDGRAVVLIGGGGFSHGLPLDYYAYPTIGLPNYKPVAPPIDWAVAYSIARQESHFNQKVVSSAHAMGLMQVTPEAAIDTAKRYKVAYNRDRLLSDPVYNMQMGAAELSMLLDTYNGNYLLTFAGYNAGRGRVRQWVAAYGDPRDPHVDPIDWVERIPFAETRNYVQRIMENLQVYRARFGGGSKLVIEADLKRGGKN